MADHVAVMKKEWHLIEKILSNEKTIESRWYIHRNAPWNRVAAGDAIYFKNTGESVSVRAEIVKVLEYTDLDAVKNKKILQKYGNKIGITEMPGESKRYCILIFLKNPKRVTPFQISKQGFDNMASWITVNNINAIKR